MESKRKLIREPFSGLSHFAGAIASVVALVVLIIMAHGRPWHIAGFVIYGVSLILLYTSSGLYHSLHVTPRSIRRFQRLDYATIFLLISGTYAPICLVPLRGPWGWGLLAAEYTLALIGIAAVLGPKRAPDWLRVTLYICMGWLAVIAIIPLARVISPAGVGWLVAGGLLYSGGTVVYATERPRLWPGLFGAHDLWHLFVLGGSACHLMVMLLFVARMP